MTLRHLFLLLLMLISPLVSMGQDPKQQLNDQMWEAARKGDAVAVTAALDKGADVNAKFRYGTTALFKASERGNTEVVKVLLARGADVTVKDTFYGSTAMSWALDNDHIEVVKVLLAKDTASVGDVLMTGVREGKLPLVELALAQGGLKPDALTSAYALVMDDKEKANIAEMLKKAGAVPPLVLDAAALQTFVGKFKPETGNEFTVSVKDGKLFVAPTGQREIGMMALDNLTFKPLAFDGIVISFTMLGDKADSFTLKQGTNTTVFKRVEEAKQ